MLLILFRPGQDAGEGRLNMDCYDVLGNTIQVKQTAAKQIQNKIKAIQQNDKQTCL
jgi:hypothetical protein